MAWASGGSISTWGAYTIHTFTSSGTLTCGSGSLSGEILVCGQGGGGCRGGGGGGQVIETSVTLSGSMSVTVGTSGGGGGYGAAGGGNGYNGSNSSFGGYEAWGGGGGGGKDADGSWGANGGGGGASSTTYTNGGWGQNGNYGGGNGYYTTRYPSGGGGSQIMQGGLPSSVNNGGNGGNGYESYITGSYYVYAAGGGGGVNTGGTGGNGGGGGGNGTTTTGTSATQYGSGGGGCGGTSTYYGGNGKAGVVIIRYLTPVYYNIAASHDAHTAISPDGNVSVAQYDTQYFYMYPDTGYELAALTIDGSGVAVSNPYVFDYVTANHSIYAESGITSYYITTSAGAGGSITASQWVGYGSSLSIYMTPDAGYHLESVTVDGGAAAVSSPYTFSGVTTAHSISCTFAINTYTISTSAGAGGSITGTSNVNYGGNISIYMTPSAGYYLASVTVDGGAVSVSSPYTFSYVTANHTISCTFAIYTYLITTSAGAGGSITGSQYANYGSNLAIYMTPSANYHLESVTVDGVPQSVSSPYTFYGITAAHSISCTFHINQILITTSAGANGSITGSQYVGYGGSLAIYMTPNANYHLESVTVDGSGAAVSSPYTFSNVTTAHSISCTFHITAVAPSVTTSSISANTTGTTATGGGDITSDGGASVTDRGTCWGTSTLPTQPTNSHTHDGTGTGTYASALTGLTSGQLYYVRAWATNSQGTTYGNEVTFTTPHAPTVTSTDISANTTGISATSGGNVTDEGGLTCTHGVVWNTAGNPTITSYLGKTTDTGSGGAYTSYLTSLAPDTTYRLRAWGDNSAGTGYGSELVFTTPHAPALTTGTITNIVGTTAKCTGSVVTDLGGLTVTHGVCWKTSTGPTKADSMVTTTYTNGTYTSDISGLSSGVTYYAKAWATNTAGTTYGAERVFMAQTAYAITPATLTAVSSVKAPAPHASWVVKPAPCVATAHTVVDIVNITIGRTYTVATLLAHTHIGSVSISIDKLQAPALAATASIKPVGIFVSFTQARLTGVASCIVPEIRVGMIDVVGLSADASVREPSLYVTRNLQFAATYLSALANVNSPSIIRDCIIMVPTIGINAGIDEEDISYSSVVYIQEVL